MVSNFTSIYKETVKIVETKQNVFGTLKIKQKYLKETLQLITIEY